MGTMAKAVEIFKVRGGAKGRLYDPETEKVCVLGATYLALGLTVTDLGWGSIKLDEVVHAPEVLGLHEIAQEMYPEYTCGLDGCCSAQAWHVNDDLGYEAAMTMLEKAAVREAETEGL